MEEALPQWKEFMKQTKSTNLPEDIVYEILSRLPVKSIVRLRSACKAWCTLFGDTKFIADHLNHTVEKNNYSLLLRHIPDSKEEVYYMWSNENLERFDKLELAMQVKTNCYTIQNAGSGLVCEGRAQEGEEIYSLRSKETFEEFGKLEVPVRSQTKYYSIVESFNGLICMTESNFNGSYHSFNTFLWNPATKEFRALPESTINRNISAVMVVGIGFAFHPVINDYKVVRIVYFIDIETYEVEVYSLSTDCWRKIKSNIGLECYISNQVSQAYINGALHWMVTTKGAIGHYCKSILAFDVIEEKFSQIGLPDFGYLDFELVMQKFLTAVWDKLVVFVYRPFELHDFCDIWVMKEYGSGGTWTLYYTFQHPDLMAPFGFFDNGNIIMEKSGGDTDLVSCNPFENTIESLGVSQPARMVKYVESLVSTKEGGGGRVAERLKGVASCSDACSSSQASGSS